MTISRVATYNAETSIEERKIISDCIEVIRTAIDTLNKYSCEYFYSGDDSASRDKLMSAIATLETLADVEEMA